LKDPTTLSADFIAKKSTRCWIHRQVPANESAIRPAHRSLKVIPPSLHHCSPLSQVLRVVVRRGYPVPLLVCQLHFDVLMIEPLLVQQSGSKAPKAMPRHPPFEPHSLKRFQDRIV
jgi:hypothetical protein